MKLTLVFLTDIDICYLQGKVHTYVHDRFAGDWCEWHWVFQINYVEVVAVVNDAVGTLMSAAHSDRQCEIGLILGQ
jgi:hypothetical protein